METAQSDSHGASSSEGFADAFKAHGFRCTDTPDREGIFCTGGSPKTFVTIPKRLQRAEKLLFYAHGLVNVCGNGASGERYLKYESFTLLQANAIAIMPWRGAAGDTSFPLSQYIQKYDRILGQQLPLILAGHSAAGPFFASELNGNGKGILSRVEKVLILDGVYGDQASRWNQIFLSNPNLRLHLVSTTTADRANRLYQNIRVENRSRVLKENLRGGHCEVPALYFKKLVK